MKKICVLALLLALCLTLGALSGCTTGKDTTVAAAYGDTELPAGIYIYYIVTAHNDAYNYVEDPLKNALDQKIDGTDASDWITARAKDMLRAHAAVEAKFSEYGLTLDETALAEVSNSADTLWINYGDEMQRYGISRTSVEAVILHNKKSVVLQDFLYGKGGEKEIPEQELLDYYQENYRRVAMLPISLSGLDEEKLTEAKALFSEYTARAEAGESLLSLMVEEYARTQSVTPEQAALVYTESTYERLVARESSGYPAGLLDQVFEAEQDTLQKFESDTHAVLFEVHDLLGDGSAFENSRKTLVQIVSADDYRTLVLGWADEIGLSINEAAVRRYTPKAISSR